MTAIGPTVDRAAPGYRAALRHQPSRAFDNVGPQLWTCHDCGAGATYAHPLDVVVAPPTEARYSHVFVHRGGSP